MMPPPHGCQLIRDLLSPEQANTLCEQLIREVDWTSHMRSRHTASMGVPYNYAGASYPVAPWHPAVRSLADHLASRVGHPLTNALLNYYPTGRHAIGWHHDDVDILAPGTAIYIVSLGVERELVLRAHDGEAFHYERIALPQGSLLRMGQAMQGPWLHSMRRAETNKPRVSVSLRHIVRWPETPPPVPPRASP